jgi:hypothetical protein
MLLIVSGQRALARKRYVTSNAYILRWILFDRRKRVLVDGFCELYYRRRLAVHTAWLLCIEATFKPLRGRVS